MLAPCFESSYRDTTPGTPRRSRTVLCALVAFLSLAPFAGAQTLWTNSAADSLWATKADWSTGALPTSTTAVVFDNTYVSTAQTINMGATNRAVGTATFNSSAAYTLNNGTSRLQISTAGTNLTQNGSGNVVINAAIYLTNGLTMTGSGAGTVTFNGSLSDNTGTDSLTKNGSFTLVLNGTNNTQDGTIINAGTVEFGSNSVSSNGLTLNGGTIRAGGGARSIANAVTVGGNFTIGGTNDLTLAGTVGLGGATRIVTVDNTGSTVLSGVVSNGGITKAGTGALTLSGINTYTSATTINAGTLKISTDTNLGAAPGSVTAGQLAFNGGTLESTATMTLSANRGVSLGASGGTLLTDAATTFTYNGIAAGTGTLTKDGAGTLVLGGANTFTGGTNISAGTLQLGATNVLADSSAVVVASGATFDVNSKTETVGSLAGAGNVSLGTSGALTAGGNNSSSSFTGILSGTGGSVTKTGTGALSFGGTNTFSGGYVVSAGSLVAQAASVFNSSNAITVNTGSILNLGDFSQTIASLTNDGTLALGAGTGDTLTLSSGSSTLGGSLTGAGTIVIGSGASLTLASNFNNSNVNLILNGGSLFLNGTSSTFGSVTVNGSSVLDFGAASASTLNSTTLTVSGGAALSVNNWANTSDFFYTQNFTGATPDTRGAAPANQITYATYSSANTAWQSFDHQLTPVPEPSTYGAIFVGLSTGVVLWRRRVRS